MGRPCAYARVLKLFSVKRTREGHIKSISAGASTEFSCIMEAQQLLNADSTRAVVKATIQLGSETYFAHAKEGLISEQLISVKEQSMSILKDFITKHNIPNDVPDEPEEFSSEEEDVDDMSAKPQVKKSKKLQ